MPFVLEYRIINRGDASASEIELMDKFNKDRFIVEGAEDGTVKVQVDDLSPNSEYKFNVTVTPKMPFNYESSRARIRYNSGMEDSEEPDIRLGSSSSLGRVRVLSKMEYIKLTSYYVKEWIVFALGFAAAIILPFKNLKGSQGRRRE